MGEYPTEEQDNLGEHQQVPGTGLRQYRDGQVATIEQAQGAKDYAEKLKAVIAYRKKAGAKLDELNPLAEEMIRAERAVGIFLAGVPREKAGRPEKNSLRDVTNFEEALRELDYAHRTQAMRVMALGAVPDETVEAYFTKCYESREQITKKDLVSKGKTKVRDDDVASQRAAIEAGEIVLPQGVYDCLVLDPPWPYGTPYNPEGNRASNPYPEMSLAELNELPVSEHAAADAVLWLWTTHEFMRHAFPLLDCWGFEDKAILTWVKDRMGLGRWLRSQSEFCIMAVRGKPQIHLTNQTTVLNGPMREHSRKPDEFFAMVEELCVSVRRIDWFGREARPGWEVGGNDVEKFS